MILKLFILVLVTGLAAAENEELQFPDIEKGLCKLLCTRIEFEPICASNGVTYGSVCQFKCARVFNKYLNFKAIGMCGDETACSAAQNNDVGCAKRFGNILTKLYNENCQACMCSKEQQPGKYSKATGIFLSFKFNSNDYIKQVFI